MFIFIAISYILYNGNTVAHHKSTVILQVHKAYAMCYCSLVPRSSNNSQAHLKFCFAKGACSLLNHILTQPDSKCLAAV